MPAFNKSFMRICCIMKMCVCVLYYHITSSSCWYLFENSTWKPMACDTIHFGLWAWLRVCLFCCCCCCCCGNNANSSGRIKWIAYVYSSAITLTKATHTIFQQSDQLNESSTTSKMFYVFLFLFWSDAVHVNFSRGYYPWTDEYINNRQICIVFGLVFMLMKALQNWNFTWGAGHIDQNDCISWTILVTSYPHHRRIECKCFICQYPQLNWLLDAQLFHSIYLILRNSLCSRDTLIKIIIMLSFSMILTLSILIEPLEPTFCPHRIYIITIAGCKFCDLGTCRLATKR